MGTQYELNAFFNDKAPSSTLAINEHVKALWQKGEKVFHMGFGESRFAVHPKLQAALADHVSEKSYLPSRGLPALCESVAEYYSNKLELEFSGQQVMIGPGSKALIYGLQHVLEADLFLPTPSWVSYAPQAELLNNKFHYIPASPETNYQFDLKAFDQLVQQSSNDKKLLIINSPNNPTGQMYSESFLKELAEYCRKNNILVISDEIYFLVEHGDVKHCSIAKFYPEGTFILGGLSKHLSIGGWRLGVAVLPDTEFGKKLMSAMAIFASEIWSSVASPIQYAAITAYSADSDIEDYIKKCARIHGIRTRFIYKNLSELGIACTKPQGAFYITANFDQWSQQLLAKGIATSSQLAKYLLENHSIATLPADSFGIESSTLSLRLASSYLDMEKDSDSERLLTLLDRGVSEDEFMLPENHPNTHAVIEGFTEFVKWIGLEKRLTG